MESLLEEVYNQFANNVEQKPLLWMDVVIRQLAVLINVAVEQVALDYLIVSRNIITVLEKLLTGLVYKKED